MSYVLVTPVRDEEAYIEETLRSVVNQTERPDEWIIVSDGSTDRTDEIIQPYADSHPFINFIRNRDKTPRDFASQVFTIAIGLKQLTNQSSAFIGFLDGDIRLDPTYYQTMLTEFKSDEKLGLAGGALHQKIGDRFVDQKISEDSVAGGVQLFRRACFEAIGGYIPIPKGGFDSVAEVMARMQGWKTKTFSDIPFYHLKTMNSATGSLLYAKWQQGERDYLIGNHALFELFRCAYRASERPYVFSSAIRLAAYAWLWLRRGDRAIPREVVRFKQSEQLGRLRSIFSPRRVRRAGKEG